MSPSPPYSAAQVAAWLSPSQWARAPGLQGAPSELSYAFQEGGGVQARGNFLVNGRRHTSHFRHEAGAFQGECACKPSGVCAHVGALALLALKAWKNRSQAQGRSWEALLAPWLPPAPSPARTPWVLRLAWQGVPGQGRTPALCLGVGKASGFAPLPWQRFRLEAGAAAHEEALHAFLADFSAQSPSLALPLPGARLGAALLVLARWPGLEDHEGHPLRLRFDQAFRGSLENQAHPDGSSQLKPLLLGPDGPLRQPEALQAFGEAPFLWGHHQGLIAPLEPSAFLALKGESIQVPATEALRFKKGLLPALVRAGHLPKAADEWPQGEAVGELVLLEEGEGLRVGIAFSYGKARVAQEDPAELVGPPGGPYVRRDRVGEKRFAKLVADFCGGPQVLKGDPALAFLGDRLPAWQRAGRRLSGLESLQQHRLAPGPLQGHLGIRRQGEAWALSPSLHGDSGQADAATSLEALRQGQRHVRLDSGEWAPIPPEWAQLQSRLLAQAPKGRKAKPGELLLPLWALSSVEEALGAQAQSQWEAKAEGLFKALQSQGASPTGPGASAGSALPAAFVGELRPYQLVGLNFLRTLRDAGLHGILADDMGLGKTVQMAALLAERQPGEAPDLIVCPASVLPNWAAELARFAPSLKVASHHGHGRDEQALEDADVVLTTYALARLEAESLANRGFRHLVLDEAQAIKNAGSQTAQALRAYRAQHRWALTGTPMENHVGELWSLFHFLLPGLLGSAERFKREVELPLQSGDEVAQAAILAQLRRQVAPFMLRRLKSEVAQDLPERIELLRWCELLPGQAEAYQALRRQSQVDLEAQMAAAGDSAGQGGLSLGALTQLLRLRQLCCHPKLLGLPELEALPSGKLEAALELLEELKAGGHRALVFSQFTSFLALLREAMEDKGWAYEYLDGSSSDRAGRVKAFQEGEAPFFLISLKAGGVGLNLTAADHVVHLDPWWNPAVEAQATDRAHRIGQKRTVVSHKLITRHSVEEKLLSLQGEKRALAETLLAGEGAGGKLDLATLRALLA